MSAISSPRSTMPILSPLRSPVGPPPPAHAVSCNVGIADFRACIVGPADIVAELRSLIPTVPMWRASDGASGMPITDRVVARDADTAGTYRVAVDGRACWTNVRYHDLIPLLEWALTGAAVDWLGQTSLLFHAGALARQGQGLLLPAISGSGKTTLTTALVAEGFHLCSDEIGLIDPAADRLLPFPKRLCVKEGAYAVLDARYPGLFAGASYQRRGTEMAWYVDPGDKAWADVPVPVRFVVFPRYLPGSCTRIAPIARSAALALLLEQSFSARRLGCEGIARAVAVLRDAECYALTVGDLAAAVALLHGLYDRSSAR